jgi:hypothetical protein
MKISAEDLAAYFDAKGIKGGCPLCGTDDWSVVPLQAAEISLDLSVQMVRNNSSIPVLPVTCQNCGFVRMHHTFWIQRWLAERRYGGG